MSHLTSYWTRAWVRSGTRALALIASAIIAALLIGAASIWAFIGPASAEFIGDGHYVRGVGAQNANGFWLGALGTAHNLGNGEESYCVSMWDHSPAMASPAQAQTVTQPSVAAPPGLKLTTAELAYLLDAKRAHASADTRAALAYLAHMNFEQPSGNHDPQESIALLHERVLEQKPFIDQLARQFVAEAQANTPIAFEPGSMEGQGVVGTVSGVGVRSHSGWVAGIPYTVELVGDAVFMDGQSKVHEGVTPAEPMNFAWQASAYGQVVARVTFHQVPRQSLTLGRVGQGYQDLLTIAARPADDSTLLSFETAPAQTFTQFQPQARTDVGQSRLVDGSQSGATISDTVRVMTADDSQTWPTVGGEPAEVTFHGVAYAIDAPLAQASVDVPQSAKIVGETHIKATGPGEYRAQMSGVSYGFVTWVWRVEKNDPSHSVITDVGVPLSDLIVGDWRDEFGLMKETTSVRHQMQVDSAVSVRQTRSGTYMVDDVFVHGLPQDHGQFQASGEFMADVPTLKQSLYFFPQGLEVSQDNLAQAREIAAIDIPSRLGFHPSVGANEFKMLDGNPAGVYVFVTTFPGDARVAPFQSDVTDEHEWVVVEPEKPKVVPPEPDTPQSKEVPPPVQPEPLQPQPQEPVSDKPAPKQPLVPEVAHSALPRPLAQTGALAVGLTGAVASGAATLGVGLVVLRRRRTV